MDVVVREIPLFVPRPLDPVCRVWFVFTIYIYYYQADSEESGAAMCNAWANHALSAFEGLLDVFVYQGSGALQDHAGAR